MIAVLITGANLRELGDLGNVVKDRLLSLDSLQGIRLHFDDSALSAILEKLTNQWEGVRPVQAREGDGSLTVVRLNVESLKPTKKSDANPVCEKCGNTMRVYPMNSLTCVKVPGHIAWECVKCGTTTFISTKS